MCHDKVRFYLCMYIAHSTRRLFVHVGGVGLVIHWHDPGARWASSTSGRLPPPRCPERPAFVAERNKQTNVQAEVEIERAASTRARQRCRRPPLSLLVRRSRHKHCNRTHTYHAEKTGVHLPERQAKSRKHNCIRLNSSK